jgi:hypothetical protein
MSQKESHIYFDRTGGSIKDVAAEVHVKVIINTLFDNQMHLYPCTSAIFDWFFIKQGE